VSAEEQKKAAALAAFEYVKAGMKVGLGTGSTANYFIDELGKRAKEGLAVTCVATSKATFDRASALGLQMVSLDKEPFLDVTVDGADEFDSEFRLIKGGGGALLIEKIVASSSRHMVVIADQSKQVKTLGKFPLPVEVTSFGFKATAWKIERAYDLLKMKPKMTLRTKDGKPVRTDSGNLLIDCSCGAINDPGRLEFMLNNIPGVVNNGLFIGISGIIVMGTDKGVQKFVKT
jgi:ribose 5-phosphate isomerase A